MKKKQEKINSSGVTLIALIISVIIMLILATVAISSINEDGLAEKVNESARLADRSKTIEEAQLDILFVEAEKDRLKLTSEELESVLLKYGTLIGEGNILEKMLVTAKHEILVTEIYKGELFIPNNETPVEQVVEDPNIKLEIAVTPEKDKYIYGDEITIKVTVTNDGNCNLSNIVIEEENTENTWNIANLNVGENYTIDVDYTVTIADMYYEEINKTFLSTIGDETYEQDITIACESVNIDMEFSIEENGSSDSVDGYDTDDDIYYDIRVTNTGNVPLLTSELSLDVSSEWDPWYFDGIDDEIDYNYDLPEWLEVGESCVLATGSHSVDDEDQVNNTELELTVSMECDYRLYSDGEYLDWYSCSDEDVITFKCISIAGS